MTDRLTERPVWDASGMERIPFDGRTPTIAEAHRRNLGAPSRNHGPQCSGNPEVGCVCGYDPGEYLPAGEITAGMFVEIYGGTEVEVLTVQYGATIRITYRWADDAHGRAMTGRLSLPASQRLRVVE